MPMPRLTDEERARRRQERARLSTIRINAIRNHLHDGATIPSLKDEGEGENLTRGDNRAFFNLGSGGRRIPMRRPT